MDDLLKENILEIIEEFSHEFYVIEQDFDVQCTCMNFDTKQADPNCTKCLGTGYKIKIKKVIGASADTSFPNSMKGTNDNILISVIYYVNAKYPLEQDNIIIDGDNVYSIYRVQKNKGFNNEVIYNKALTVTKKLNPETTLKNFHKIVGDK